jgi:hypothetical protein
VHRETEQRRGESPLSARLDPFHPHPILPESLPSLSLESPLGKRKSEAIHDGWRWTGVFSAKILFREVLGYAFAVD